MALLFLLCLRSCSDRVLALFPSPSLRIFMTEHALISSGFAALVSSGVLVRISLSGFENPTDLSRGDSGDIRAEDVVSMWRLGWESGSACSGAGVWLCYY